MVCSRALTTLEKHSANIDAFSSGVFWRICPSPSNGERAHSSAGPGQRVGRLNRTFEKPRTAASVVASRALAGNDGTNWDEEMSTFRKRILKPNQLATLRQIEEQKVDVGKVGFSARRGDLDK